MKFLKVLSVDFWWEMWGLNFRNRFITNFSGAQLLNFWINILKSSSESLLKAFQQGFHQKRSGPDLARPLQGDVAEGYLKVV
jgi:hypothetical protein